MMGLKHSTKSINIPTEQIVKTQTQLNWQFNLTEIEVILHSYCKIHPPTTNYLLWLLLTSQLARRDLCVQLYSRRPV